MRIVTKFNLVLAALVGASVVLNFAALKLSVGSSFLRHETLEAGDDHDRVERAVQQIEEQALATAADYGVWDETTNFITGRTPDYIEKYVYASSLRSLGVNYLAVIDAGGRVLADVGFDFSTGSPVPTRLVSRDRLPPGDPMMAVAASGKPLRGLVRTDHGIAALAVAPVRMSDDKGPAIGILAVATLLDAARLADTTKVAVSLAAPSGEPDGLVLEPDIVRITSTQAGLDGKPVLQLVTRGNRDISRLGANTVLIALALVAAVAAMMSVATAVLLRRLALSRIATMRAHLVDAGRAGDLSPMPEDRHGDELSEVVHAFNAMAMQLAELRDRLRRQDYESGASDHAAAVMHNIRNAITPINAIAADLATHEAAGWKAHLATALLELRSADTAPERAAKLTEFVLRSSERLLGESERRLADLNAIGEIIRQIAEMLNDHAAASRADRRAEAIDPVVAFRHARRIVERRQGRLVLDLPASLPPIVGRAVLLSEVFANLFVNAAESIEAAGRDPGHISVTGTPVLREGQAMLRISVTDDGAGIDGEALGRIFENGFSTKGQTARGIGLHWSANAVIAMGGTIRAESPGRGLGATIHVELPAAPVASSGSHNLADAA